MLHAYSSFRSMIFALGRIRFDNIQRNDNHGKVFAFSVLIYFSTWETINNKKTRQKFYSNIFCDGTYTMLETNIHTKDAFPQVFLLIALLAVHLLQLIDVLLLHVNMPPYLQHC